MNELKILLVDDEEEFVMALAERLLLRGFGVSYVFNAREALNTLAADDFGVAIIDYKLPGMNGIELMKQVKKDFPKTEVHLMTGAGSFGEGDASLLEALGSDLLLKPIDFDSLVKMLNRSVSRR